jgi:hypothetical protein
MKRIVLAISFVLLACQIVWAAGSCIPTQTESVNINGKITRKYIELTCTGDGSIAAYNFSPSTYGVKGWYLYSITTNPGTAAPTADYDITLMVNGEDIAGGLLADRSATATQTVLIAPTTLGYHMAGDTIAITFANQTANPSTISIKLRFSEN